MTCPLQPFDRAGSKEGGVGGRVHFNALIGSQGEAGNGRQLLRLEGTEGRRQQM
jgi:hypothetical protein